MADASDIFSDNLDLFSAEDPMTESPSEVHYGPIHSKIVSRSPHRFSSHWCSFTAFFFVRDSSLILKAKLSLCLLPKSSIAALYVQRLSRYQRTWY